jgi:hypothetical protein
VQTGLKREIAFCAIAGMVFAPAGAGATTYRMLVQSHAQAGSKCLDVPHAQFVRDTPLQAWDCNNTVAQIFFYDDGKRQLSIGNLCVEVRGAANTEDVGLGACNNQPNQLWRMVASKDYYQIVGLNNRCLALQGGNKNSGAKLDVQDCDATKPHRLWALIEAPAVQSAPTTSSTPPAARNAPAAPPLPPAVGNAPAAVTAHTEAQNPDCRTEKYIFSAILSQSVSVSSVSTGGGTCSYSVAPIHPDKVQFTSASIVKQPSNGTFDQVGGFAFKYQPNPGFKGSDEYAIRVCGHASDRAGCATITYRISVN